MSSPKPILVIKLPNSTSLNMIHQSHNYVKEKGVENDYDQELKSELIELDSEINKLSGLWQK